MTKIC